MSIYLNIEVTITTVAKHNDYWSAPKWPLRILNLKEFPN